MICKLIPSDISKIKNQQIPRIDKEIDLLKNVELRSINKKIEFNQQKLKEYQNDANRISNQTSIDNSQNMLMAIQLLNTQNLILNLQNGIENLIKEKEHAANDLRGSHYRCYGRRSLMVSCADLFEA